MIVHLVDGTYELFRAFYGAPSSLTDDGREVGATRALLRRFSTMLPEPECTHIAIAFDTAIESFRNQLFPGYKTGDGIDPALWSQFALAERATRALGIVTWSMYDFEADDAIATFAARATQSSEVTEVRICSPDKDFGQCVGDRVVLYDRRKRIGLDRDGIRERLGVLPEQVASWLALVGDTADGIPGIPRWGARSAARVLEVYPNVAAIPDDVRQWKVDVRGAPALAAELAKARDAAMLYEKLATLRLDVPLEETLDDLKHRAVVLEDLAVVAAEVGAPEVYERWKLVADQAALKN